MNRGNHTVQDRKLSTTFSEFEDRLQRCRTQIGNEVLLTRRNRNSSRKGREEEPEEKQEDWTRVSRWVGEERVNCIVVQKGKVGLDRNVKERGEGGLSNGRHLR